jgi:hypothetical protein
VFDLAILTSDEELWTLTGMRVFDDISYRAACTAIEARSFGLWGKSRYVLMLRSNNRVYNEVSLPLMDKVGNRRVFTSLTFDGLVRRFFTMATDSKNTYDLSGICGNAMETYRKKFL